VIKKGREGEGEKRRRGEWEIFNIEILIIFELIAAKIHYHENFEISQRA